MEPFERNGRRPNTTARHTKESKRNYALGRLGSRPMALMKVTVLLFKNWLSESNPKFGFRIYLCLFRQHMRF